MLRLLANAIKLLVTGVCGLLAAGLILQPLYSDTPLTGQLIATVLFVLALACLPWIVGPHRNVTAVGSVILGLTIVIMLLAIAYQGFSGRLTQFDCSRRNRGRATCDIWNWLFDVGGPYLLGAMAAALSVTVMIGMVMAAKRGREVPRRTGPVRGRPDDVH